mgnify:CR=1 FL=1
MRKKFEINTSIVLLALFIFITLKMQTYNTRGGTKQHVGGKNGVTFSELRSYHPHVARTCGTQQLSKVGFDRGYLEWGGGSGSDQI